uniref:PIR Superfamily Protein n=1 Tax=Pyxicephalus adspersus TaxID=30357 RepID=A0AAV3B0U0_PYXAD|nr:TPA: hypothetical protein GDO54_001484 [Pyxicephalus adspersus]
MKCSPPIEDNHLKYLDEMIDAQLNTSCSVNMKVIDSEQLDDYCYKRGVISQLSVLMERLEFKPYSQSYNYTKILNNVYNQRFKDCIDEIEHITQEDISPCSRYIDLSPSQNLERVKMSFVIFRDFKANSESEVKCFKKYRECKDDHLTKGPHCACISPTTPICSGAAIQTPLSTYSEIKSTPHASIISFSMTGTDSQISHQSSESIELPSDILTSTPTVITIMDNLHTFTTDQLVSDPESPHTKMDISTSTMESITESTFDTSLS